MDAHTVRSAWILSPSNFFANGITEHEHHSCHCIFTRNKKLSYAKSSYKYDPIRQVNHNAMQCKKVNHTTSSPELIKS